MHAFDSLTPRGRCTAAAVLALADGFHRLRRRRAALARRDTCSKAAEQTGQAWSLVFLGSGSVVAEDAHQALVVLILQVPW